MSEASWVDAQCVQVPPGGLCRPAHAQLHEHVQVLATLSLAPPLSALTFLQCLPWQLVYRMVSRKGGGHRRRVSFLVLCHLQADSFGGWWVGCLLVLGDKARAVCVLHALLATEL